MSDGGRVRDHLWIWAHPEGAYNGPQWGLPADSRVTPVESAAWLGVPNVIFIHYGDLPREPLRQYAKPFEAVDALMWSIVGGGGETSDALRRAVLDVATVMPNLTGVFMDDFFHFRGRPPSQWLAAPRVEFPVIVDVEFARPITATGIELGQSDWVGGDHRTGDLVAEFTSATGDNRDGVLVTMPDEPGERIVIDAPGDAITGIRVRILNSHDSRGALSCGLTAIRVLSNDKVAGLDDATVRVSSRYPIAGRNIEERMAVTDGREGAHWADPALLSPDVLISTQPAVAASLTPEELAEVRRGLRAQLPPLELGVAIYDYQLDVASITRHLELVDLVILWHWSPADLKSLEGNVAKLRAMTPGRRMMIGLYMWDFAQGREIPLEAHRQACATALELLRCREIDGIVFLAGNICDLGIEAVEWTRGWVAAHGDHEV